ELHHPRPGLRPGPGTRRQSLPRPGLRRAASGPLRPPAPVSQALL
ncbi:MAG: hypothetical protein AVDCRST_MAG11-3916, partial [uncultured Gemmatimonadaceae bacterium]